MATTELTVTATPGKPHSFSAKAAAADIITELSVMAIPGRRHSFSAKSAAIVAQRSWMQAHPELYINYEQYYAYTD